MLAVYGEISVKRAYYYCRKCGGRHPWDEEVGLDEGLSPGVRPLLCLAGVLTAFAEAADDVLKRLSGIRVSASTVLRTTEKAGEHLQEQQHAGQPPRVKHLEPGWSRERAEHEPQAYIGVDAFSVPMQGPDGSRADHRMLYLGVVYTPDKRHKRYVVDFDLNQVTAQLRHAVGACGIQQVEDLIAITDGGNGIEPALHRAFADNLVTILDWYHATQHIHAFGRCLHGKDPQQAGRWSENATHILQQEGGEGLLRYLRELDLPKGTRREVREELRKLTGYFESNRHRTNYPHYRSKGWDIGSGPTEAGCKIIGSRLKGSGMRWAEPGAEAVGTLRALYVSSPKLWDAYWQSASAA